MTATGINKKYKARIKRILCNIRDACKAVGLRPDAEPSDMSCDDFRYNLVVRRPHSAGRTYADDDYDVTLEINESEECDGTEDGINFAVNVVQIGGAIVGGLSPFNYTDQCWVSRKDPAAIEERFQILEAADAGEVAMLIKGHIQRS